MRKTWILQPVQQILLCLSIGSYDRRKYGHQYKYKYHYRGYIFKVPADDYASRIARAIVSLGRYNDPSGVYEGGTMDGTHEVPGDAAWYIKVGTDEYIPVDYDTHYKSSYEVEDIHRLGDIIKK